MTDKPKAVVDFEERMHDGINSVILGYDSVTEIIRIQRSKGYEQGFQDQAVQDVVECAREFLSTPFVNTANILGDFSYSENKKKLHEAIKNYDAIKKSLEGK